MESIGLRLVAHIILAVCGLPFENLLLAGADVIALVVLPDLTRICPQAAEGQRGGAGKRHFPVDQEFALDVDAAALGRQVIEADVVQSGLGNVYLPGSFCFFRCEYTLCPGFALSLKGENVNRNLFLHGCFTGMGRQISAVRIAASNA